MSNIDKINSPDFFILGPQKTGTSSLFFSLSEHPELTGSSKKEPHFFDNGNNYQNGNKWYESFFEGGNGIKFEATPNYFSVPISRSRMRNKGIGDIKPVKFVLILRDPCDRFISHYSHFRRYNKIVASNPKALDEFLNEKRPKTFSREWIGEPRSLEEVLLKKDREHLVSCGEYIINLKHWHALFGEKNFLMVDYNDLLTNYEGVCNQIFDFVGASSFVSKNYQMNTASYWAKRSGLGIDVSEEQKLMIKNYYKPYNEALFDYINKDLGWNN
jgi:hypothetical protein